METLDVFDPAHYFWYIWTNRTGNNAAGSDKSVSRFPA